MFALISTIAAISLGIVGILFVPYFLPGSLPVLLALGPFAIVNIFAMWLLTYSIGLQKREQV